MEKKSFNLSKFNKKAFYEGSRGYWLRNSRCWPNCLKVKMDGDSKSKQEAYNECIAEYNEMSPDKWLLNYSESYADSINVRVDHATPGSKGQAVDKSQD